MFADNVESAGGRSSLEVGRDEMWKDDFMMKIRRFGADNRRRFRVESFSRVQKEFFVAKAITIVIISAEKSFKRAEKMALEAFTSDKTFSKPPATILQP